MKNQGEGDKEADRNYREQATKFASSANVAPAAASARAAIDSAEADALNDAEKAGKARIAEDDANDVGPLPSFWSARQDTGWQRMKHALRRDWEETKSHLGLGGAHLGQTARDTIEQAMGTAPLPGEATGLDWDLARHAIRLGYGAASFWNDDEWSTALEDRLRVEWTAMDTGLAFEEAISLARYGWEQGRKDTTH